MFAGARLRLTVVVIVLDFPEHRSFKEKVVKGLVSHLRLSVGATVGLGSNLFSGKRSLVGRSKVINGMVVMCCLYPLASTSPCASVSRR